MQFETFSKHENRQVAWRLRHRRGWTLERIGRRLGVSAVAVSKLLARASERGAASTARATRPRLIRPLSLSAMADA